MKIRINNVFKFRCDHIFKFWYSFCLYAIKKYFVVYTCQIHYLWILFYKICELYLYINEHFTVFLRFNRIFNISLLKSSIWENLILVELLFYGCTSTKTTFICNLSNKLHIIFNHFLFLLKTFNVSFPFMIRTLAHIWTLLTWKWENNLPWIYMP